MAGEGVNLGTAVGYIEIRDNVDAATRAAQGAFDNAIRNMSGKMKDFGDGMTKLGGSIALLSAPLMGFGVWSAKASIEFESAFANVKKTVDGTDGQLKILEGTLRRMATSDTPLGSMDNALLNLTKIAEKAGSLGVPLDKIAGFTESVALLAAASDDLDADQAATFIGQFRNVTNMDFSEVALLVDTVVTLGSKMATTEGQLATFTLRLAPLANYKWDEKDILAYGSALASLGVSPELGGSNLLKSVMDMNVAVATGGEPLRLFAEAAGLTADEFAALAESDPQGAFLKFIEGLALMDATDQILTLQKLGITGGEQITLLQRLAGGQETLNSALKIADEAWKGNGAAMDEATKKAETTQGVLDKVNNHLYDMRINVGNALTDGLARFGESLIPVIDGISRWAVENPAAVQAIAGITLAVAGLGGALVVMGMIITNTAIVFGALSTAIGLVAGSTWITTAATWAINGAMTVAAAGAALFRGALTLALGPIGWIAAAIAGLIALLVALEEKFQFVSTSLAGWNLLFTGGDPGKTTRGTMYEDALAAPVPTEGPLQRPIPGFATGGYTGDGPANQIKGVVHANEWVFTRDQMAGLLSGGGGRKVADNINIYANSRAEGYTAATAFEDEMEYALRAQR